MSVKAALLGLLDVEPSHGYDLKTRYDSMLSPEEPVKAAQVYATLGRLERDGKVEVARIDQSSGPERTTYRLTTSGRDEFRDWLETPVEVAPHVRAVLFMKVLFALMLGHPLEPLIDTQMRAHLVKMRELTTMRRTSEPSIALLADYAIYHLEADIKWLEIVPARAESLRTMLRSQGYHTVDSTNP